MQKKSNNRRTLFRVKFCERESKDTHEVVVTTVSQSEYMGLVVLEGFQFSDSKRAIIMPNEDDAKRRFGNTERLHIPFHNIIYVEEFDEEPADLHKLPFIKEVPHAAPEVVPPTESQPLM